MLFSLYLKLPRHRSKEFIPEFGRQVVCLLVELRRKNRRDRMLDGLTSDTSLTLNAPNGAHEFCSFSRVIELGFRDGGRCIRP